MAVTSNLGRIGAGATTRLRLPILDNAGAGWGLTSRPALR